MKFTYQTATGNETIEVSEEWHSILTEMDRHESSNEKKETRRHLSLDGFDYEGDVFAAEDMELEELFSGQTDEERLIRAIGCLTEKQKLLIEALYYKHMKEADYAQICGVTQEAISQQKATAIKKLKKFF